MQIAEIFGGDIWFLPERKGNRMTADVMINKTVALGWRPTKKIQDYINSFKKKSGL